MNQRVYVTGMGAVSPHGRGVARLWSGLIEGRSAMRPIQLFDASSFRNAQAGEVEGYSIGEEPWPRSHRMLLDACREALLDASGETPPLLAGDVGALGWPAAGEMDIVAGTNFGGMSAAEFGLFPEGGQSDGGNLGKYLFGSASQHVAEQLGLKGRRVNLSLACASGTAAIGMAFDLIRTGRAQAALACGYDELSLFVFAGLSALRAVTTDVVRPFDRRRKGTLFSEGAGAVVLESEERIQSRGRARRYARVLGRAMNNDGYHMTAPEQEATGIRKVMRAALDDADCEADAIDHFNLHATGTPYNDKIETAALKAVFGGRYETVPVCAVKSSMGHTMGAAGVLESIVAIKTLNEGYVPPVLGLDPKEQDPECNLNAPTGTALHGRFERVLKTSYGFGGTNAAIVLGRV